jgi:hypothetical protein
MQHHKFESGGGVIHKITGDFKGRVSAWYDENGKLEAAEQLLGFDKTRGVMKGGPLWNSIQEKVRRFLASEKGN